MPPLSPFFRPQVKRVHVGLGLLLELPMGAQEGGGEEAVCAGGWSWRLYGRMGTYWHAIGTYWHLPPSPVAP